MASLFGGCFTAVVVVVALLSVWNGGESAAAQVVYHVVGDDLGWDLSSNVTAWANNRIFRVGDEIWFAYSAADENIVELQSRDELEPCDLRNPILMYASGLDKVSLDREGARYFASAKWDKCKNGLKLHVEVVPQAGNDEQKRFAASSGTMAGVDETAAAGPRSSDSDHLKTSKLVWTAFAIAVGSMWL